MSPFTSKPKMKSQLVRFFVFSLFIIAVIRVLYVCLQIIKGDIYPFAITEWLINYSNGFIRRGLVGSIHLQIFPGGTASLTILLIVGVILFVIPALYALAWLHKFEYSWLGVVVVCNPAAFLFAAWDTGGLLRKEALGLAALTFLAMAYANWKVEAIRIALIFTSAIIYIIAAFSSELNSFLLPCFIYLISGLGVKGISHFWQKVTLGFFTLVGASGLLVGTFFTGNSTFRSIVCDSIIAKGFSESYCGGAINLIGFQLSEYFFLVVEHFPMNSIYFFIFLPLALAPIFSTSWVKENRTFLLLFVAIVAPLFIVAADYGRTIAMFTTGLSICVMAKANSIKSNINWSAIKVIPFVTLWGLPGYIGPQIESFPWLGPFEWIFTKITQ